MERRVVVSGVGTFNSVGKNVDDVLKSILAKKSGIGQISNIDTIHKDYLPVAEVKYTNDELKVLANQENTEFITRTTLLAIIAAREAIASAGLNEGNMSDCRTGIISATTIGGMDKTEKYYYDFFSKKDQIPYVLKHECCDNTETIADLFGIKNHMATISTACSSSTNAIMFGARLIKHGVADRIIAGGTDALSKFTINGFNTLKILDSKPCRPFSNDRRGLNLGEGAGFLILEAEDIAKNRGAEILCEITGYANANDAYHQTASSPDGLGPYLAMKYALESGNLKPSDIDYINAHGTGTDNNDLTEGIAIEKIFQPNMPPVSSTKPYTGHTLGAAGAIEAIISILAIRNGIIPPNLNSTEKMDELKFEPIKKLSKNNNIRHVLSNSFGFGGNDSSLILSKY